MTENTKKESIINIKKDDFINAFIKSIISELDKDEINFDDAKKRIDKFSLEMRNKGVKDVEETIYKNQEIKIIERQLYDSILLLFMIQNFVKMSLKWRLKIFLEC